MIRSVLVVAAVLAPSAAHAQERTTILVNKNGRVTGRITASGPRPNPQEGMAILCAGGRCDPVGYAALAEQEPVLIPIRPVRPSQVDTTPDSFKLHPLPPYVRTPSVQRVPLPYPTVRVILDSGGSQKERR